MLVTKEESGKAVLLKGYMEQSPAAEMTTKITTAEQRQVHGSQP